MVNRRLMLFVGAALSVTALIWLTAANLLAPPRYNAAMPDSAGQIKQSFFYAVPDDPAAASAIAARSQLAIVSNGGDRDDLRAAGFGGKILRYFLGKEVEGPGPYANAAAPCDPGHQPLGNQVANQSGEFCALIHPHEDWFLHNGKGERLYLEWFKGRPTYLMNPRSEGWRAFVLERIRAGAAGYDGVFLDNIELDWFKLLRQTANSDGAVQEFGSNAEFRQAMVEYLQLFTPLRESGSQVWANLINDPLTGESWNPYLAHLDGVMQENYATGTRGLSVGDWQKNQRQVETALSQNKGVVLVGHGPAEDTTRQQFAVASYLLVTTGADAYFRYSPDAHYVDLLQYPIYDVALGAPLGPSYKRGGTWRRDFACGYVTVDPQARTSEIARTCP